MTQWLPRILILGSLGLILGLPFLLRPEAPKMVAAADAARLVIITPHNEQIRYEMARAFSRWHQQAHGRPVEIDWRVIGGSSDVLRLLKSQYEALATQKQEHLGAGYDLVFGGGDDLFDRKLKKGVTVLTPQGESRTVSITEPLLLDAEFLREAFPTPRIADRLLYDPEGHWYGVVLTSFGIVYNRDVLNLLGLPEPQRWHDLTDPRYFGWVGLSDPAHSGSVRVTYEAILRRAGWENGWPLLRRICANSRYFSVNSAQIPIDTSTGEAAAGMSIDFYGRFQAQVVGGNRMGYVAPAGETVINADPVAILRGAPHRELAERFVKWLLTREAQLLWNLPVGDPLGPERWELRRSPARRDCYAQFLHRMVDKENPFEIAKPMPKDVPSYFDIVPTVLHAMAIDTHDELKAAWKAIIEESDPARRAQMEQLFDDMPFDLAQLQVAAQRWKQHEAEHQDRLAWTRFFLARYRQVVELKSTNSVR